MTYDIFPTAKTTFSEIGVSLTYTTMSISTDSVTSVAYAAVVSWGINTSSMHTYISQGGTFVDICEKNQRKIYWSNNSVFLFSKVDHTSYKGFRVTADTQYETPREDGGERLDPGFGREVPMRISNSDRI
jgi:hypothetical protein